MAQFFPPFIFFPSPLEILIPPEGCCHSNFEVISSKVAFAPDKIF